MVYIPALSTLQFTLSVGSQVQLEQSSVKYGHT